MVVKEQRILKAAPKRCVCCGSHTNIPFPVESLPNPSRNLIENTHVSIKTSRSEEDAALNEPLREEDTAGSDQRADERDYDDDDDDDAMRHVASSRVSTENEVDE